MWLGGITIGRNQRSSWTILFCLASHWQLQASIGIHALWKPWAAAFLDVLFQCSLAMPTLWTGPVPRGTLRWRLAS